jgi:uncharacterized membrane protein
MSQDDPSPSVEPLSRVGRAMSSSRLLPGGLLVLAVVLPPVGALLGHLYLDQLDDDDWRALVAVIVGWIMAVVMVIALVLFLGYDEQQSALREQQAKRDRAAQELDRAVEASPSYGKVDAAFCRSLVSTMDEMPPPGWVQSSDQVTPGLLSSLDEVAAIESPNQAQYSVYRDYLVSFDDHTAVEHVEMYTAAKTAFEEDSLACIPLVDLSASGSSADE